VTGLNAIGNGLLTAMVNGDYSNNLICTVFTIIGTVSFASFASVSILLTIVTWYMVIGAVGFVGLFVQWLLLRDGGGMKGRELLCPSAAHYFLTPPPLITPPATPRAVDIHAHIHSSHTTASSSHNTSQTLTWPTKATIISNDNNMTTLDMPAIAGTDTFIVHSANQNMDPPRELPIFLHDIVSPASSISSSPLSLSLGMSSQHRSADTHNHDEKVANDHTHTQSNDQGGDSVGMSMVVFHYDPTDTDYKAHRSSPSSVCYPVNKQASNNEGVPNLLQLPLPLPSALDAVSIAVSSSVLVTGKNQPKLMSPRKRAISVMAILFNYDMRHLLAPCMAIYGLTQGPSFSFHSSI
jgi:hypothetical protein